MTVPMVPVGISNAEINKRITRVTVITNASRSESEILNRTKVNHWPAERRHSVHLLNICDFPHDGAFYTRVTYILSIVGISLMRTKIVDRTDTFTLLSPPPIPLDFLRFRARSTACGRQRTNSKVTTSPYKRRITYELYSKHALIVCKYTERRRKPRSIIRRRNTALLSACTRLTDTTHTHTHFGRRIISLRALRKKSLDERD